MLIHLNYHLYLHNISCWPVFFKLFTLFCCCFYFDSVSTDFTLRNVLRKRSRIRISLLKAESNQTLSSFLIIISLVGMHILAIFKIIDVKSVTVPWISPLVSSAHKIYIYSETVGNTFAYQQPLLVSSAHKMYTLKQLGIPLHINSHLRYHFKDWRNLFSKSIKVSDCLHFLVSFDIPLIYS